MDEGAEGPAGRPDAEAVAVRRGPLADQFDGARALGERWWTEMQTKSARERVPRNAIGRRSDVKDIRGSHGIVTGASRGIGTYIAKTLAAQGVSVTLAAR